MVNPKFIEGMAEQLGQMLSQAPNLPGQDAVQEQIRAVLQNSFAKLDLVTRDEFDAQTAVLHRTREKLEQLEQVVAKLEAAQQDQQ